MNNGVVCKMNIALKFLQVIARSITLIIQINVNAVN